MHLARAARRKRGRAAVALPELQHAPESPRSGAAVFAGFFARALPLLWPEISWRYFGIEFLTGVLFVLALLGSGYLSGGGWNPIWVGSLEDAVRLAQTLLVISCLLVVFWIDYETFLIPLSAALLIGMAGVTTDAFLVWRGASPLTDGTFFSVPWLPLDVPSSLLAMVVLASFLFLIRALASALLRARGDGFRRCVSGRGDCRQYRLERATLHFFLFIGGRRRGDWSSVARAARGARLPLGETARTKRAEKIGARVLANALGVADGAPRVSQSDAVWPDARHWRDSDDDLRCALERRLLGLDSKLDAPISTLPASQLASTRGR